jgi:hypothetical protein
MTILYRGAGFGTYWHTNDARLTGFLPRNAGISHTHDRVVQHVYNGRTDSPYVSLTLSYGVALNYALEMGTKQPTVHDPAYVYEIEITASHGVTLIDPVKLLASGAPDPLDPIPYQHNGNPNVLIGAVWPMLAFILRLPIPVPPWIECNGDNNVAYRATMVGYSCGTAGCGSFGARRSSDRLRLKTLLGVLTRRRNDVVQLWQTLTQIA